MFLKNWSHGKKKQLSKDKLKLNLRNVAWFYSVMNEEEPKNTSVM